MNLNKILKNPVAVSGLCIFAGAAIYMNVIMPLTSRSSTSQIPAETVTDPVSTAQPAAEENMKQTSEPVTIRTNSIPPSLKSIGWKREAKRNPFLLQPVNSTFPIIPSEKILSTTPGPFPEKLPQLHAISIGPWGKIALLGNLEVREGDSTRFGRVVKIDADSILLGIGPVRKSLHFRKN